jgi:hypothetical protein
VSQRRLGVEIDALAGGPRSTCSVRHPGPKRPYRSSSSGSRTNGSDESVKMMLIGEDQFVNRELVRKRDCSIGRAKAVAMLAVLVLTSPGNLTRLPPTVKRTHRVCSFCRRSVEQMRRYVAFRPSGMSPTLMNRMVSVPSVAGMPPGGNPWLVVTMVFATTQLSDLFTNCF